MWQAPSQRVRALTNAKKRERDKARRPIHIKRVMGQLKILGALGSEPVIAEARVLLNDMTSKGVGLFCGIGLATGQEISITIQEPKQFFIKAKVMWCQEYNSESHILSKVSYAFRVGVQFVFSTPEEEKAVADYCAEISGLLIRAA
jgi:hypothetical protein